MQRPLSSQERQKIAALVTEIRSRGLAIPEEYQQILRPNTLKWPIDSRGYFSKRDGKFYDATENQGLFIADKSRFVGFYGSRGSGKTGAGSQKALKKISQGNDGIVMNPDFENLKISTWPEFREWIPWDMVATGHRYMGAPEWSPHQPFNLNFLNGVRVIVKGVKDPSSARGPNVNWLWYDEASRDADGMSWKIAVASTRVGFEPQNWATFTPKGKMHWCYDLFIKQDVPEEVLELIEELGTTQNLIQSYFGSIEDNKDNLDKLFYASMLMAYPSGWLRQQEIGGRFVDEGGILGDPSWFDGKILFEMPEVDIRARVRYWDLAATEKKISGKKRNDPDETVGTKWAWDKEKHYIEHQVCGFWEWDDIKQTILRTAIIDGPYTKIWIEQEPAAGGKNQVAEIVSFIRKKLPGHAAVEGHRPEGDKVMRANTWFAEAKAGMIFLIAGNWVQGFLDQLSSFPEHKKDDRIDSASGARHCAAPIRKWGNIPFLNL